MIFPQAEDCWDGVKRYTGDYSVTKNGIQMMFMEQLIKTAQERFEDDYEKFKIKNLETFGEVPVGPGTDGLTGVAKKVETELPVINDLFHCLDGGAIRCPYSSNHCCGTMNKITTAANFQL